MEYPQQYEPQPPRPLSAGEEQGWGVGLHLGGLVAWVIAPLIVWLVFRDRSRMLDDHGKAVLNWQITVTIIFFVFWAGSLVTMLTASVNGGSTGNVSLFFVLFGLMFVLFLATLVVSIVGAVAAYRRRSCWYPPSIPFFR